MNGAVKILSLIGLISISIISCTEVPVVIPTTSVGDTTVYRQNVLIEEYTGVRCQNCPAGAKAIEDLKNVYKDRLVVLSIHGGFFAQPTNAENKFSLDNNDGKELIRIYNQPLGYPSAIINRKQFDGTLFVGGPSWAGHIANELQRVPDFGLQLITSKDIQTRTVNINCQIKQLNERSAEDRFISVVIVENNIIDAQLTPTGVDINYIHNHVMRKFITPVQGEKIVGLSTVSDKSFNYRYVIPAEWNMTHVKTVAILHKGVPLYEVLQVAEK